MKVLITAFLTLVISGMVYAADNTTNPSDTNAQAPGNQGAMTAPQNPAMKQETKTAKHVMKACKKDIRKYCKNVDKSDQDAVSSCLQEQTGKLSKKCVAANEKWQGEKSMPGGQQSQ